MMPKRKAPNQKKPGGKKKSASKRPRIVLDPVKHNLVSFTTEESSRYVLDCVAYVPELKALAATDGALLAIAEVYDRQGDCPPVCLSANGLSDLMFAKPPGGYVVVTVGKSHVYVDGYRAASVAEQQGEKPFPNVAGLVASLKHDDAPLCFDARRLRKICEHALSIDPHAVLKWRFADGVQPSRCDVLFDGPEPEEKRRTGVYYLLMPMVSAD